MNTNDYEKTFRCILRKLRRYSHHTVDTDLLMRAYHFAEEAHKDQLRKSGVPYFEHCIEVAKILCDLRMDYFTIAGGLLHDVMMDTGIMIAEVEEQFGKKVAVLVDGVTKISELKFDSLEDRWIENFRKMLLSMVKDIRVILIKFADQLHNMRTIEYLPEKKRIRIAIETRDIYAPLAHRLGIAKIRWELEDLILKTLAPKDYWKLVQRIAEKREEREAYIRRITVPIRKELKQAMIAAKITGRPKHFYSIYQKMLRQEISFEEVYDLSAIRIITKRVEECYFALGIIHSLFTPIEKHFKDYIATPKPNMYQSLHTTVIGPNGKMVEIQIRTEDMHRTAEEGIAAHWRYKESKQKEDELDKHLVWLRPMIDWQYDSDPQEFMENLRIELFQDEVFVFTPKRDVLKLPVGSTPVDFAFAVHTKIGFHCLGAKVNGKIVPLNYKLKSGDSIEIITGANQKPNLDWIKFVRTPKARSKIKQWIKESMLEQSQKLGEELLNRQFKHLKIKKEEIDLKAIVKSFDLSEESDLFSAVGCGDITAQRVINRIAPEKRESGKKDENFIKKFHGGHRSAKGVRVQGIANLLIHFGKCCQPVPGDRILGFVTQGQGVVIHRTDCKNIHMLMENPERKIEVEWDIEQDNVEQNKRFVARLRMLGENRKHFLRDVSDSISQTDANIVSVEMRAQNSLVHSDIIIEVENLQHLTHVINKIGKVAGVINVERLDEVGELVAVT